MKKTLVHSHFVFGLAIGLLVPFAAFAGEQDSQSTDDVRALATQYLETLYRFDFESLREFASPDLILEDPTAALTAGAPLRLECLDSVAELFGQFAETMDSMELEIEDAFVTAGHVVFWMNYLTEGDGAFAGRPGTRLSLRVPAVTVLRIDDGRVIHHLDHADYASMVRQATDSEADSSSEEVRAVAMRYLETLYRFDFDALTDLTADDLAFSDPTSTYFGGEPWSRRGRDEIFEFFAASSQGIESAGFEVKASFVTGDTVVLWLRYVTKGDGAILGAPGTSLDIEIPGATILRVRDGRVFEHLDHVDYESMMSQVEAQKAATGSDG